MSDAGSHFISDMFRQLCKCTKIEQVRSLSHHHQSNGQVEVCIMFVKHTMKQYIKTNDIHIPLLHIRAAPLEPGLPSPGILLFNHQIKRNSANNK